MFSKSWSHPLRCFENLGGRGSFVARNDRRVTAEPRQVAALIGAHNGTHNQRTLGDACRVSSSVLTSSCRTSYVRDEETAGRATNNSPTMCPLVAWSWAVLGAPQKAATAPTNSLLPVWRSGTLCHRDSENGSCFRTCRLRHGSSTVVRR